MEETHLLDLDMPNGDEFLFGADDILSVDFFVNHASEETVEHLYNQLEFENDYGRNLCTIYGPITTLSAVVGRELVAEERKELSKRRYNMPDFDPSVGGKVTEGVNCIRKWWNETNPNDQVVTFMINNSDTLRKTFFKKKFPLVSSFKGNAQYNADIKDGVLNALDYWNHPFTYGHCLTYYNLVKEDNYNRRYSFRKEADYFTLYNHGVEGRTSFAFFRLSDLSETGKKYYSAMKDKIWNGERPDEYTTRVEAALMIQRMGKTVPLDQIWNGKDGDKIATRLEIAIMAYRAKLAPEEKLPPGGAMTRGELILKYYKGKKD